jgi:Cft2 family RNA processing exonuclease
VEICGIKVTTGRNGHAPGGVWLHLQTAGGLLYMGDYSVESGLYAVDRPPAADTLILDASYGTYDTPLDVNAAQLALAVDKGPVLLPVPAPGRGPEIALHLMRSGRGMPYVDESVKSALVMLTNLGRESIREDALGDLQKLANEALPVCQCKGAMLVSVADASSGEAARRVGEWEHETEPALVFTGYVPPGTAAERLTRSGRASYLRWNVHPRLSDNAALVRATGARTVLPAFGEARYVPDWTHAFAPARVLMHGPVTL